MLITDLSLAERTNETTLRSEVIVKAGTTVVDGGVLITVTQAGADCDCGKGLYCPENTQEVFDPRAHHATVLWLCEHPVQSVHHNWAEGEQDEYDGLRMIGRRVYDQLRTQLGLGHAQAWLISRAEFGLKPFWEGQKQG